ncbi:MAG: hypothetical protein U0935_00215 [Pirellulales bacterium]
MKTDRSGQVVKQIDVGDHHGNLCFHNGQVYVAVNFGKFNDAEGNADSWVFVYDAGNLALLAKHNTPEVIYGAGGIAYHDRRFVVVGGWPEKFKGNNAYEYDAEFKFVKLHRLKSLTTLMGIQTAAFADGHWWFGCYGDPKILLKEDESFSETGRRFEFDCSLRIVPIGGGKFLMQDQRRIDETPLVEGPHAGDVGRRRPEVVQHHRTQVVLGVQQDDTGSRNRSFAVRHCPSRCSTGCKVIGDGGLAAP